MHLDEVRLSSCRGKQMSLLLPESRNYIAFFKINVACTTLEETPGLALIKKSSLYFTKEQDIRGCSYRIYLFTLRTILVCWWYLEILVNKQPEKGLALDSTEV